VATGTKLCGAKTSSGGTCKRAARPNGRCNLHGGKNLAGAAHPQFKHGRYSRYMPARLVDKYAEAQDDPELLSVRDEVALLHARISEVISRLYTGESGSQWKRLKDVWGSFEAASVAGDAAGQSACLNELRQLIARGAKDEDSWRDLTDLIERKTKVASAEWKRLVDLHQVLTVEQAMTLATVLVDSVMRHVDDDATRRLIAGDISRLINLPGNEETVQEAPGPGVIIPRPPQGAKVISGAGLALPQEPASNV
jgi:hypothetical protein